MGQSHADRCCNWRGRLNLSKNELNLIVHALEDRMSLLKHSAARKDRVGDVTREKFAHADKLQRAIQNYLAESKHERPD